MEGMIMCVVLMINTDAQQSDHPPHFTIHLNEVDLQGGQLLLDLEIEYQ